MLLLTFLIKKIVVLYVHFFRSLRQRNSNRDLSLAVHKNINHLQVFDFFLDTIVIDLKKMF